MKQLKPNDAKCQGAYECMRTCARVLHKTDDVSYAAIRVDERPDGGFHVRVCTQCGVCIDICPTLALRRNKAGIVVLDRKKCVGCMMCVAFCPEDAMFQHPKLEYPIKCIACGQCVKTCPHGALELAEVNLSDVARETATFA